MNFTEQYLRAFFEGSPSALSYQKIILDDKAVPCDYEFIGINHAMEDLFQINKMDIIGKKFSEVYPVVNEKTVQWIKNVGKVALFKNTITMDIDVSVIQKRLRITLFTVDKYYCAARYMEINGKNQQRDNFEEVFKLNLDMLCVADTEGKFIKVNQEFKNVLNYEVEELEGRQFLSLVHKEDVTSTLAAMKELKTRKSVVSFINRFRHKDGFYKYIEWRSRPKGKYIYSSARDITEKKMIEIKLQQTNDELVKLTEKIQAANEMLKSLATTDELTGLYNRHFFDQRIETEMERADRANEPLALIIFDLDHFKRINDTWGHLTGDEVLKQTATVIGSCIRNSDVVSRVGGEEFAVIMPKTTLKGAMIVAEKLRQALAANLSSKAGKITGSFGVAERLRAESFRRWYKRADNALYQAKNQGRNRVVACMEATMPIATVQLEWRGEWECGHTQIDEQHRELLIKAGSLVTMLYAESAKGLEQLDMLLNHIVYHFKTEEQILVDAGYPDVAQHTKIHEDLVRKALYFKDCYQKGKLHTAAFLSYIVDDVVMGHMVKEDVKFFPYIKKI